MKWLNACMCVNSYRKLVSGLDGKLKLHALLNGKQLHNYCFTNGIYACIYHTKVTKVYACRCLYFKLNLSSRWHSWTPGSWFEYWSHQNFQPRFEWWTTFHPVEARSMSCRNNMISNICSVCICSHAYYNFLALTGHLSCHSLNLLQRRSIPGSWAP